MAEKIAFQGELGAYSHEACVASRPDHEPLPCATFEDVIAAVKTGAAEFAMLPVENTTYGRVADMHRLLPESGLFINDEVFVRVRINLLALPGVALSDIKVARGHLVILPQCRKFLAAHGLIKRGGDVAHLKNKAGQHLTSAPFRQVLRRHDQKASGVMSLIFNVFL